MGRIPRRSMGCGEPQCSVTSFSEKHRVYTVYLLSMSHGRTLSRNVANIGGHGKSVFTVACQV